MNFQREAAQDGPTSDLKSTTIPCVLASDKTGSDRRPGGDLITDSVVMLVREIYVACVAAFMATRAQLAHSGTQYRSAIKQDQQYRRTDRHVEAVGWAGRSLEKTGRFAFVTRWRLLRR
ncbi:hypothetical protein DSM3645_16860 [Blastopirellula marina DSM 3645]|uniref:Uncharacterized protein n=1 Tax=Blastopirellula marina DSM 3645 TaxID=314230 RepID=A3ZNE7_9BACT|nr:hypothetical protein DSM3645_16860 [Blastopirellula marina DSM 3645]